MITAYNRLYYYYHVAYTGDSSLIYLHFSFNIINYCNKKLYILHYIHIEIIIVWHLIGQLFVLIVKKLLKIKFII